MVARSLTHHFSSFRSSKPTSQMTIGFLRPVGAAGDVKELEYISALHQTDPEIRTDGSIKGEKNKVYVATAGALQLNLLT